MQDFKLDPDDAIEDEVDQVNEVDDDEDYEEDAFEETSPRPRESTGTPKQSFEIPGAQKRVVNAPAQSDHQN